ncbi:DUF397 domain-containing protein [Amycolatopsis sp. CA-230715]|uniref:DUF397 domain-containing protein n=1 Tax=Amycolatopsis sp. CA-230715 TaxID=2745196 RepID=UPI001C035369|nr:DUF397 domain-containing protein [Amycolatopsis sp. CA-230715]QWF84404.1 hypothetical protein HUW46_07854 [Amycolatopsis sp. CA-230715]
MIPRDLPSPHWFKSSYSDDTANCVEVTFATGAVGVRDSKAPTLPALVLPALAWEGFVRGLSS